MLLKHIFSLKHWFFVTLMLVTSAHASTPFSQYGMIQNVQSYSNNPLYNPNAAAITIPKIIYATGPALKAGDCERTVDALVANICAQHNNCQETTLADIRPELMIQLSNIPGYNYASSCGGYIDTIYEKYTKQHQNTNYVNASGFPTATAQQKTNNQNIPQWQSEYNERAAELKTLQAQNTPDYTVNETDFPTTVDDLSFQDSIALKKASYAPYQNAAVYVPLDIERDKNTGTQSSQQLTECQRIYACISNYGKLEHQAENVFYTEQQKSTNSPEFNTAKTNLITAIQNAILSACTCTEKSSSKDAYRRIMGVQCNKSFTNQAQIAAQNYVTSL